MIRYKVWSTTISKVEIERETAKKVYYRSERVNIFIGYNIKNGGK